MHRSRILGEFSFYGSGANSSATITPRELIFLFIYYVLPTSFFGLIPSDLFFVRGVIDLKVLYLSWSFMFGCFFPRAIWSFLKTRLGVFVLVLMCLLISNVLRTSLANPVSEVLTVFRSNFSYLFPFLVFASYLRAQSLPRLRLLLKCLVFLVFFHSIIYIADFATGGAVMAGGADGDSYRMKVGVDFNVLNIPMLLPLMMAGGIAPLVGIRGPRRLILPVVGIIVGLVSTFRGAFFQLVVTAIGALWISRERRSIKAIAGVIVVAGSAIFLALGAGDRIVGKFSEVRQSNIRSEGTFAFRLDLIDQAIATVTREDASWMGLGYRRVANAGDYDYVMGSDSYLPPVIFAEGFLGLAIRCGLISFVFLMCWQGRRWNEESRLYCTCGMLFIISEFLNPVQSAIFVKFDGVPLIAYWSWLIARGIHYSYPRQYEARKSLRLGGRH